MLPNISADCRGHKSLSRARGEWTTLPCRHQCYCKRGVAFCDEGELS